MLPPSCQLVLLIAQGEIKYLPPLPLVLIYIEKKYTKGKFKNYGFPGNAGNLP